MASTGSCSRARHHAGPSSRRGWRGWYAYGTEARGTEFAFATRRHVRNFLDAVKSRQKPNCDMEAGFAASLPCLLANVAIQQEQTLKWDGNKVQT